MAVRAILSILLLVSTAAAITTPVKPVDPEVIFDHASMAEPNDWENHRF